MYVRKSDRDFIHACEKYLRSTNLQLTDRPGRLYDEGNALIEEALVRMRDAVAKVDKEAVEASEARVALGEAEAQLEISFGDLYDGAVMARRFERLGSGSREHTHLPDVDRYLEGNTPTLFASRGRADKRDIMAKALEYASTYLANSPVPDDVATRAGDAQQTFVAAFETLQAEEGDVLTERNEADKARAVSHREFRAGRQLLSAALTLADSPQPIHELLPSLSDIVKGNAPAPAPADDEPAEPAEPVEA